jgi:hypothetical protein
MRPTPRLPRFLSQGPDSLSRCPWPGLRWIACRAVWMPNVTVASTFPVRAATDTGGPPSGLRSASHDRTPTEIAAVAAIVSATSMTPGNTRRRCRLPEAIMVTSRASRTDKPPTRKAPPGQPHRRGARVPRTVPVPAATVTMSSPPRIIDVAAAAVAAAPGVDMLRASGEQPIDVRGKPARRRSRRTPRPAGMTPQPPPCCPACGGSRRVSQGDSGRSTARARPRPRACRVPPDPLPVLIGTPLPQRDSAPQRATARLRAEGRKGRQSASSRCRRRSGPPRAGRRWQPG